MSNYDIGSLAFGTVSLLVDDLFVCDQCGEGEDKEYRSELFEHEDICTTCAGNGR
jgi:formylmethanofuran dehydrogenase subunit E